MQKTLPLSLELSYISETNLFINKTKNTISLIGLWHYIWQHAPHKVDICMLCPEILAIVSLLQNGYCVENLNEIHSQLFDGSPLPVKVVILSLYNAHACLSIAKL